MSFYEWPEFAKIRDGMPTVEAHSRGSEGFGGHYAFGKAGGARVVWSVGVPPMRTAEALKFRAFLHSLRKGGTVWMRMPGPTQAGTIGAPAGYSDSTLHSDGTPYDDATNTTRAPVVSGTAAAAAAGASALVLAGITAAVGYWLKVVTADGPQVVRIVSASGGNVGIRPALRAAVAAGASADYGPVICSMRLTGDAPPVPLINGRSRELTVELEEAY